MIASSLNKTDAELIKIMQALGDPTRYQMFKILLAERDLCVSEIARTLGVTVSAASQHFRIFEYVGLVDRKRNGRKICYSLKCGSPTAKDFKNIVKGGKQWQK